jgi:hypothetical protein
MHSTLQFCGQVTKKMHCVSAQNEASRFKQAAATFLLSMHQYVRSPLFQDGVSGVHEIDTIYKDGRSNFLSTENIKTPQNCCKLFAK